MNNGMLQGILYLVCLFLLLPCTLVTALLLLIGKGKVNKGLWCAASVLSVLSCVILAIADLLARLSAFPNPGDLIWTMLPRTILPMLCYIAAALFPLTATLGRKGGWKPLLLAPALIACLHGILTGMGRFSFQLLFFTIPAYLPLLLMLVLAVIWYYTGKKTWLGIMMGLYGLMCLLLHPLVCTVIGEAAIYGTAGADFIRHILPILRNLLRSIGSHGILSLLPYLRATGFPMAAYAVLSMLTIAGLQSKRLPKETAVVPAAAKPAAPQPEPIKPAAARFCTKCGSKLEDGAKFCMKCGTPV